MAFNWIYLDWFCDWSLHAWPSLLPFTWVRKLLTLRIMLEPRAVMLTMSFPVVQSCCESEVSIVSQNFLPIPFLVQSKDDGAVLLLIVLNT